jgi:outer membrane protein TolC
MTTGKASTLALITFAAAAPLGGQNRSVTLEEAVDMALRSQPAMVQARGQVETADATKLQSYGSWLPTLSANSSASTNSQSRWDERTQTTITGSSASYSGGLSASLTLFDGFSRIAEGHAAGADLEAADASLVNQSFQTVLQTKQAFFNALAAEELVRVSDTRIERATGQLNIAKEKLAAGTATRSDTLRSFVEVANARLQRLNAVTQLATAEANLARLIGVDGSVSAVRDEQLFALIDVDTAALRGEALQRSPTIRQAEASVKAADAQFKTIYSQYLPRASASYSRSWSGQEWLTVNPSWSLRLSLSWTIFNGFTRELTRTQRAISLENSRAQAEDAVRQVNADLTQHLASLSAARTRLEIAEANQAASEEDLRVQQERYRLGAATIVEVLASQENLDQAEVDRVQSYLDYLVAKAQIEALIGREL